RNYHCHVGNAAGLVNTFMTTISMTTRRRLWLLVTRVVLASAVGSGAAARTRSTPVLAATLGRTAAMRVSSIVSERLEKRRGIDHCSQRWVLVCRCDDFGPTGLKLLHAFLDVLVERGPEEDSEADHRGQ